MTTASFQEQTFMSSPQFPSPTPVEETVFTSLTGVVYGADWAEAKKRVSDLLYAYHGTRELVGEYQQKRASMASFLFVFLRTLVMLTALAALSTLPPFIVFATREMNPIVSNGTLSHAESDQTGLQATSWVFGGAMFGLLLTSMAYLFFLRNVWTSVTERRRSFSALFRGNLSDFIFALMAEPRSVAHLDPNYTHDKRSVWHVGTQESFDDRIHATEKEHFLGGGQFGSTEETRLNREFVSWIEKVPRSEVLYDLLARHKDTVLSKGDILVVFLLVHHVVDWVASDDCDVLE